MEGAKRHKYSGRYIADRDKAKVDGKEQSHDDDDDDDDDHDVSHISFKSPPRSQNRLKQ